MPVFVESNQAQVRGVYPLGMNATNSGVTPESGLTYSNQFLFYARDELKGTSGDVLATGQNSVLMDLNSFVWVSTQELPILGKPRFSASATLPVANNSLTSDVEGAINGGGGFADSYYQPVIIGWRTERASIRAIYGFLAPTGSFIAGGTKNVGSGYWTHTLSSGQTFYFAKSKLTNISAFEMYEFHTTQEGTKIHPGQNFNVDYSFTHSIVVHNELRLQIGIVGYEQWQMTDKSGPNISLTQATAHYVVNALGIGSNVLSPDRGVTVGFKYFKEFSNNSTFQGYSAQISGAIHF
jgi:hypothetical protein